MSDTKVKLCRGCNTIKSWDDFTLRTDTQRPIFKCKECLRVQKDQTPEYAAALEKKRNREREKRAAEPERYRGYDLKKKYGITLEEYNSLYDAQGGKCAICLVDASALTRNMHVDHNHVSNTIRGLLCHHCNTLIGLAKEDQGILQKAITYLLSNEQGVLTKL